MAKRRKRKAGLQKKVSSVFEGVPIPQRDGDQQTSRKPAPDGACGDLPRPMPAASLVSQSSLLKRVCRSESSTDMAATDRMGAVLSERMISDHPASPSSPTQKLLQTEKKPDKAASDRTIGVPPKLTIFDRLIPQSPPVEEPWQAEDSLGKTEPDRTIGVPPKLTAPDYPVSQSSPTKEPEQAENFSEGAAPSSTSRVPPKLTAPDHPISQGSSTKETEQPENARDKAEPGSTDGRDAQIPMAAEDPASRISLMKKLHQDQSASDTEVPDRTAQAPPIPASPDPQMSQKSASEELHRPEVPPKEAAPSGQRETAPLAAAGGPSLWQRISNKLFASKPGVSPTRQKVMMISVPILAIILIFVFRQVLSKSPRNAKGAAAEDVPVAIAADSGHEIDWQIPEPLPATMRDPTKLSGQIDTQSEEQNETVNTAKSELINIGPIVYSHDKPSAVINGRITYVGDVVNGVTILRIHRDGVECEKDGEKWLQKRRN